jgi:uncharacterized damage-inducible protein DinB
MLSDWLGRVMLRDLGSLSAQLEAYPNEKDIWTPLPGVPNSTGTLVMHLAGNIQHFVGAQLGHTGYSRDREAEFNTRDLSRAKLLRLVDDTRSAVRVALSTLSDEILESEYPIVIGGAKLTTGQFLIHLAAHLAYHLGQVDYHRRMVTKGTSLEGMLSIPALF